MRQHEKIIVTGGAGFIGSALCRYLIGQTEAYVVNIDKLTYAADLRAVQSISDHKRYHFIKADICQRAAMDQIFADQQPGGIIHLAAESHVDRSITGAGDFIQTNINGTFTLLEAARRYWSALSGARKDQFRFLQVSTDEVYGSLGTTGLFNETTPYDPSSPYSASKAAADHLVKAWQRTYGLPTLISNCSNNYGPYQFPEKLIPLMILKALQGEQMPVYGDGTNIRDWLYVDDHAAALYLVFTRGRIGQSYNVGGGNERSNLQVVTQICDHLDQIGHLGKLDQRDQVAQLNPTLRRHKDLISFVPDRPGHDQRYAIDASKLTNELGWQASETFESGLAKTIEWYLGHEDWWRPFLAP